MLFDTVPGGSTQQAKLSANSDPCWPIKCVSAPHSALRGLWLPVEDRMPSSTLTQLNHTAGALCCRKTRYSLCPTRDCGCFQHLVKILESVPVTVCSPVLGFLGSTVIPGHSSLFPRWPELRPSPLPIHQETAGSH